MINTTSTTWWYGINPDANFCPKCGCSVNWDTFKKDHKKFGTFNCECGWIGYYSDFLNAIEVKKMFRKKKIIEIDKNV